MCSVMRQARSPLLYCKCILQRNTEGRRTGLRRWCMSGVVGQTSIKDKIKKDGGKAEHCTAFSKYDCFFNIIASCRYLSQVATQDTLRSRQCSYNNTRHKKGKEESQTSCTNSPPPACRHSGIRAQKQCRCATAQVHTGARSSVNKLQCGAVPGAFTSPQISHERSARVPTRALRRGLTTAALRHNRCLGWN